MVIVRLGAYYYAILQCVSMHALKFCHLETGRSNLKRRIPLKKIKVMYSTLKSECEGICSSAS